GVEDGGLADAARPVQEREARRHEVRGDQLSLGLAAEEELGVAFAVREEALVRRRRERRRDRLRDERGVGHGPARARSCCSGPPFSFATYSSRPSSKMLTSRSLQN